MFEYREKQSIPFGIRSIYDMVLDVRSYPEFVPWCYSVKIIEQDLNCLIADTVIKFKLIKIKYLSKVCFAFLGDKAFIEVEGKSSVFDYLCSRWDFAVPELDDNGYRGITIVRFYNSFLLNNTAFDSVLHRMYIRAQKKIWKAFMDRATILFGNGA